MAGKVWQFLCDVRAVLVKPGLCVLEAEVLEFHNKPLK